MRNSQSDNGLNQSGLAQSLHTAPAISIRDIWNTDGTILTELLALWVPRGARLGCTPMAPVGEQARRAMAQVPNG